MSSLGTHHPGEELLLRYSDGELPAAEAEKVRKHLAACWECRSDLEQIERTIGECVLYRKALDAGLPAPPAPWFDIHRRFDAIDARANRRRFGWLWAFFQSPRQWATASLVVLLALAAAHQLRRTPTVSAAELLHKAVAAERAMPPAPRRIQIRTGARRLTRVIGGPALAARTQDPSLAELENLFRAARYNWDDPLSVKAFADWRDQLPEKRDDVTVEGDSYRIRTTTGSGELAAATLKLRAGDFHPWEETLEFRNRERVELSELPAAAPEQPSVALAPAAPSVRPALPVLPAAPPQATPGDELQVLAALHRAGADLGDPVEVKLSGSEVLVSGVGIPAERQQRIRSELEPLSRVAIRFSDPPAAAEAETANPAGPAVTPKAGPVQAELEKALGGRPAFEQFADATLMSTDAFMSRAHALRRLARQFPAAVERQLAAKDVDVLRALCREHAEAMLRSVAETQARVDAAVASRAERRPPAAVPSSWQEAAEELFAAARRAETALVGLVGGGEHQPEELPAQVLASLAELRARAEACQLLFAR